MEKPELKLLLQQLAPALPDPYEFAGEITAGIRFIAEHPDAAPSEIPGEILRLWCAPEEEIQTITALFGEVEESFRSPNIVSSLILFALLYWRHYRLEDFADFRNFICMYGRFQELLNSLKKAEPGIPRNSIDLFDLDNLDDTIDAIKQSGTV